MLLQTIEDRLDHLSATERKVALLLLQNPQQFVRSSVQTLAQLSGVSAPTVLRFCRSFGFAGLPEFKLQLAASAQGTPFIHPSVGRQDTPAQWVQKIASTSAQVLADYAKGVANTGAAAQALQHAVDALLHTIRAKGRVDFYGFGNSAIVAQDAQHKFFRLGAHTAVYADSHVQVMAASLLKKGDVAVLISNAGQSAELLRIAHMAAGQGATTIAITISRSPLAQAVNIHLAADHQEPQDSYSPMASRLLHLLVVDILTTGVALGKGLGVLPQLNAMKQALRAKKQGVLPKV